MACFIVPAAEAVVTAAAEKRTKEKEAHEADVQKAQSSSIPFSRKLSWLRNMLLGGSALLAFEHLWHGEIVPYFPFLTAAVDPADRAQMLHEMATVGVTMAVLVTATWLCMLAVCSAIEKSEKRTAEES